MVEVVPNTGFRVTQLSGTELDELVELRLLIEPPVMAEVAKACEGEQAAAVEVPRPLAQDEHSDIYW